MFRVLVVEDSRTQALQIQLLLEDAGLAVTLAGHGGEALDVLKQGLPDVVLTDLEMPVMNGLQLVEAVRRDHADVPVVLMTAVGSEEIAVRALQQGAASYVPKRILHDKIVNTLLEVISVANVSRHEKRALECLTEAEFHFTLGNDAGVVTPLIEYLQGTIVRLHYGDCTELMRLGIALHESLLNAIQHGNLEVSSELRQEDESNYADLIEARRNESPYRERRVHVSARLSPAEAVFVVTDEGPGFNVSAVPDPNDPANLERIGGRGLMLIRTFMDAVEHNERGNRITMTKRHLPLARKDAAGAGRVGC